MKVDDCPGLKITLVVNGADLFEYAIDAEEDDTNVGKRYVEIVSGSEFCVGIRFGEGFPFVKDDIKCSIYLDGQRVRGDGAANSAPVDSIKELGTIRVMVQRGRKVESNSSVSKRNSFHARKDIIPEKCLKGQAISSQATLAAPTPANAPNSYHMDWRYGDDAIATFHFLYRSRKDLQIEGVIPRSPSPVPLEERDLETLTLEEARELVRRGKEREQANVRIRQEIKKEKRSHAEVIADDEPDDIDPEVSFESERTKRGRTSRDSGVEIVDLSED